MEYEFLYDRTRHLLAIGYNVAERRRDSSYYDLLASEARLTSFLGIAEGHLPQETWFALGRLLASVGGAPVLMSWSGSMFEYLMPLLVMPSYENTLLAQTCRSAVERQIEYGAARGLPWGMSESGYNAVDGQLNYQYRAFGVPGLGLKRGLAEDLVVAPYATALALMVRPEDACENFERMMPRSSPASTGCTRRWTTRRPTAAGADRGAGALLHGPPPGDEPARLRTGSSSTVRCSAASNPIRASAPPSCCYRSGCPRPPPTTPHLRSGRPGPLIAGKANPRSGWSRARRRRSPEVQLLSNGRYHVMVTNAGGGYSRWKDLAVTRWREDGTRDHWGAFCYICDVSVRRGVVVRPSADLQRAESYEAILSEARVEFRRRDDDIETHTESPVARG